MKMTVTNILDLEDSHFQENNLESQFKFIKHLY
jgi:hypothetical protein